MERFVMLYPKVTEIVRAGNQAKPVPNNQRDLVALSLLRKPQKEDRGCCERDHRAGIFR